VAWSVSLVRPSSEERARRRSTDTQIFFWMASRIPGRRTADLLGFWMHLDYTDLSVNLERIVTAWVWPGSDRGTT